MMFKMIIFVLSVVSLGLSSAQLVQNLRCDPNINLVSDFNLTAFLGKWHVVRKTESPDRPKDCLHIELLKENNEISLHERVVNQNFLEEKKEPAKHHEGTPKFTISRTDPDMPTDFWILSTDYTTFSLAFACEDNGTSRKVHVWQLGRDTTFPTTMVEALMNQTLFSNFGITRDHLTPVDHSETVCRTLPEIPPNQNVILPGQCNPNMAVVQNFNVAAFTGEWFGISGYFSANQGGKCSRAKYTLSGGAVAVENSQVVNEKLEVIKGTAVVNSTDNSARLLVTLEVVPGVFVDSPLWVLATDYTSYAISYTCVDLPNNQRRVNAWIVSRSRELSSAAQLAVDEVFAREIDLNERFLLDDDQSDQACFYYPEPVPKQPVVFRGQCDLSIPAMRDFDAASYLGLWHNIESYPSVSSSGACNNALYTLTEDYVDVFNTQVIGQQLLTINGTARVTSTDGSAKLTVNFPIPGTNSFSTADYWVLDTDYTSYALVYSCLNINDDQQQVTSFKLSRTKQLSAAGNAAINRVIETVKVLDQRYFEVNDQSREGCFYFPEPQRGVPVRFPGQCSDTNVQVVQNFDLARFQGTWRELLAYPKDQQPGQCVSHAFTATATGFDLTTTSVDSQTRRTSSSIVVRTTTDGTARFTIILRDANDATVVIPYWIVDTDYSNYALAYSCVDISSDYRMVYSWILGRTTELSSESIRAINSTTANIDVLQERYLETVDQSDAGCFYLPDPQPGVPVVLNGQCNENIPVVRNFNVSAFLGRWQLIESYPQRFQTGTCNEANYSLNADGSLAVTNSQVINQELRSVNARAVFAEGSSVGKLLVTFPNSVEPSPFWILDTDYDSYTLAYSCRNLADNRRQITSWKLSRTNELTANAVENINRIIAESDSVHEMYFNRVNRSDEACFYYPEAGLNGVIFRGQCDENIPVAQNVDVAAYTGLWHDIASYSNRFQVGTCNNARYTLVTDYVDVLNTQVIGQSLNMIKGVARVASTDGSAKLTVTFPIAGTNLTVDSPYWVLDTDYTSYSLVYTCINLDAERRQVWSWKLSRTRQLTTEARFRINEITATIPVLDERYYQERNHSREGCFYNPEPQPGVPVVFPGQCDTNIQAMANFNMTLFQGIWHEVEAYPKIQQTGQCVNHAYVLGSNNVLNLVSTSVLDQIRDVTNSQVTFASAQDNSGRLTITLTSGGSIITIPFWIIDTDYTSYALAYSCVNNNEDYRGVFSWKLSRTQQLTTSASLAIDSAMERIDVLQQKYFEEIKQTDEACFYLPEHVPGQTVTFIGQCDENIPVVQNFNVNRFLGRWRRISSYPAIAQSGNCSQATYSLNSDGSTIDVFNALVRDEELFSISGTAVVASNDGSAKLVVRFPNIPGESPLWVLDTDYDSFSLLYSCTNLPNNLRQVTSWKMSRTRELTAAAEARINAIINRVDVLNERFYEADDQSDDACFYLPPAGPNTPIFRGQCDLSIPAVGNFRPGDYLGTWFDVASYNTVFQQGTCNTAFYSPGFGGSVDVLNTQVVNQRLATMLGNAQVASTDGTAKLDVTFPVGGTNSTRTTPYWVLATDYSSYSLVYTCVNINEEERQVWSWKLSRTRQLTNAAATAINQVVARIPVLNERYYQQRDHSDQGCFFYPEPEQGKPVVFPGQCDNTIQAVPNFNMASFEGTWYEIEAYPKENQTGQCINHRYSSGATQNILNLVSTNVIEEIRGITNSVVTFASAQDSSGRLVINLQSEGQTIVIPFWILSVNYQDYALAYSCVNINAYQRAVYSWKLSRSKTLSAAANTAINNKISEVDVLHQQYYENIDQSEDACFFLPDLAPGEPIVFDGQCDRNIPIVQNFNAARYLGRWRTIETYPSDFQSLQGQCQEANYALGNNVVDVFNTQVINQTLDTINGTAVVDGTANGGGRLLVNFPGAPVASEYWILDTDYDSYALVYSCLNINSQQRRVWSWKLSRTSELTPAAAAKIDSIVNSINVLNSRYYMNISHTDEACFYYPTPDGRPVEFRGQCDENLRVVTNFNAVAYAGLWHSISSYPTQFGGSGSCSNALYTLRDGVVEVFNTHVVNQTLNTINGTATLVPSTDGAAKLTVRFPVGPAINESPYWVLATDYTSYALVYTCVNITTERRRVSSWKLSRTRQLTNAAAIEIDRVVNEVPVLDNQYYELTDQSNAGCFYYPEPQPGVPVVFRGQCDNTIQAVPDFNMTAFQGVWHETAAYPKEDQPGQCISHEYTLDPNNIRALNLVSTNVVDQIRGTTNSRVTFTSTQDASGRLTITLTSGGQIITIPFWVLSTDYNDYALAYSCVNLDQETRAVYSWKLSRTQQLSSAGDVAINTKINEIDVLDNRYYEPIDQTIRGCFYLPPVIPGAPVDFIGQCDENLAVVQNFDAAAYLGRWRMIETYPSEFQSLEADCLEATYSLAPDGSVDVFNTQVLNERLLTINGSAVVASTDGSAKLSVTFPGAPEPSIYWVLDTDYTSFALVYSCRNIAPNRRRVWTWKLSRTRELTQTAITRIDRVMSEVDVLNQDYYVRIAHNDTACFYFPTPDGNPVTFRGQCDESISVVTGFDAVAYMGTWYDIEGYPVAFQGGTCPTATYTLTDTGVDVFNTQVVGQQLDTIRGSAVLASTDGSAKLTVTFPIAGTNMTISTPYWVLATDYTNFALVYTCTNIDSENRRVASWKLSRTKALTAASRTEIDRVIANVQVLREDYYVVRGHTEENCFYYPDNEGGPVIQTGQCQLSDITIVPQFNITAFAGSWYEISRFPSEIQEGECVSSELSVSGQGVQIRKSVVANDRKTISSGLARPSPDGRGILTVNITDPVGGGTSEMTFYVLDIVYDDFALLYSCRNVDNTRKQIYSWKLSRRSTGISETGVQRINQIVRDTRTLFEGYFDDTDQTVNGCFHYPEFDELPPIIELIGPCDPSIRGMANFNAAAYLGKWYEMASYPQPFQFGDCARAQYSLGDNVVDVVNTQVVNKTLDVMLATAVVASTDGSGVLNVTFNLPGGVVNVVNYYILETDYTNFALVYSCRNLDSGSRQVTSWKLSRRTTLSPEASLIMDKFIETTQGLNQDYYQPTNQTEDACFYIPEVNKNEAPRFRGQCETQNIVGVQGFNVGRYLGWWHEIESYPTDNNRGGCISSEFKQVGNEYHAVDTHVFNNVAQVNTSVVTVTTDGRLRRTYANGQVVDTWVVATDYETYSLLYSCENVDSQYMRIWSAKHSKRRQLTQSAIEAINVAINSTRTLVTEFYLPVNQSDDTCFHYPEPAGNRIILPGQCDENIPVVQEFDVAEYSGTWYQIERYPQIHENGTCIGARYTLNRDTGVVKVVNWQVVGDVLDVVEGNATLKSDDGSAKLIVILPIRFTEDAEPTMVAMDLYVLTTDYVSHSLAYSCVNVGPYQRAVGVWKLSRTRALTEESNSAIDAVIARRQELHQPYFIPVIQNDDCQEPSSGMIVKSSIVILLICSILQRLL